ncbi:MAG TPA: cbb3-type cytochrome oxidase assembly protein CcoS [Nitrospira sp.]|nr:cbb3-type cytochrome oxidase assembly protein CcoS [Nitrospira sp.]HNI69086.1 cbb3-type cytochrome oxidase assembly protein CcoS [Nitrospira sp.]
MEILYLLVPMSVLLVFVIGVIFWWSLRSGQFEDLEGPGYRILMDDDSTAPDNPASPGPAPDPAAPAALRRRKTEIAR